ncbi:transposase [Streptomyces sp. 3211]|uniref:transposase n=1 Tax=Streptomyces sp. 3211 TaxID=1964449 RepID=UPI0009A5388E
MQHLLGRADRDADAVRDDVRGYVADHPHDDQAVLRADETGDLKMGTRGQRPAPVQGHRGQNRERAGRCPYGLRGSDGHAAVDREWYVPRSWTADAKRSRAAGLDEKTFFATKPE